MGNQGSQEAYAAAHKFAEENLVELCEEMVVLNETGTRPQQGKFLELIDLTRPLSNTLAVRLALDIVMSAAVKHIARSTGQ